MATASHCQGPGRGVLWRGGALPEAHRGFFGAGVKYRVPGFLATSASRRVTDDFIYKVHTRTHTRTHARTHTHMDCVLKLAAFVRPGGWM